MGGAGWLPPPWFSGSGLGQRVNFVRRRGCVSESGVGSNRSQSQATTLRQVEQAMTHPPAGVGPETVRQSAVVPGGHVQSCGFLWLAREAAP